MSAAGSVSPRYPTLGRAWPVAEARSPVIWQVMADARSGRSERRAAQAAAFDQIGNRYDEAFPHKEGQLAAIGRLLDQLGDDGRVLDAGCGTGMPTAMQLVKAGLDVVGIDISPAMLDLARRNVPGASFVQADMLDAEAEWGPFDAIVAFFSMVMLPREDIPVALQRFHQLLRPGGWLVVAMVEADLDDVAIPFVGSMVRVSGYPRDQLRSVVDEAGFTVVNEAVVAYEPVGAGAPSEVQLFLHCQRPA